MMLFYFFFVNYPATTEIYPYLHTLSLHDALPIYMKGSRDGSRLTAIGKKLALETVDAESIGLRRFDQRGAELFRGGIEAVLREPEGLGRFYLSVINQLAATAHVGTADIAGRRWSEVDYPVDYARAEEVAAGWWAQDWARGPATELTATG